MTLPSAPMFLPRIKKTTKTKMKKLLSTVVASVLLCASLITGCGAVPVESVPSQASAGGDFLVGMVVYGSKRSESGYTYEHIQAVREAMEAVGLDPDTALKIRDNITDTDQDLRAEVENLVVTGCDIIFGTSCEYEITFAELAEQYPEVVFCNEGGVLSNSANFCNYSGRTYQAFYLAGIAAGYKSLDVMNDRIGFVSSWGTERSESCSDVNAFTLGALAVNPDASVYVYTVGSWGDPDAEYHAAQTLFSRYNCGIIAQDCDSAEPQLLAEEDGIFGCGYLTDMTEAAPDAHLTAPVINWSVYYQAALSAAMNGPSASEFASNIGGNYYGTFTDGFLDLSPLTDNNAPAAAEAIEYARALMISGQWDVFSGTSLIFEDGDVSMIADGDGISEVDLRGYMDYWLDGVVEVS